MTPTARAAHALLDVLALQDDTESPLYGLALEVLHQNAAHVVLAAQLVGQSLLQALAEMGCERAEVIGELREVVTQFEDFAEEH